MCLAMCTQLSDTQCVWIAIPHTYIHTCMYTRTQKCIHTHIDKTRTQRTHLSYIHACLHVYIHTDTQRTHNAYTCRKRLGKSVSGVAADGMLFRRIDIVCSQAPIQVPGSIYKHRRLPFKQYAALRSVSLGQTGKDTQRNALLCIIDVCQFWPTKLKRLMALGILSQPQESWNSQTSHHTQPPRLPSLLTTELFCMCFSSFKFSITCTYSYKFPEKYVNAKRSMHSVSSVIRRLSWTT